MLLSPLLVKPLLYPYYTQSAWQHGNVFVFSLLSALASCIWERLVLVGTVDTAGPYVSASEVWAVKEKSAATIQRFTRGWLARKRYL